MLTVIEKLFGTKNLYKILGISKKDASDTKKLRNSYLRAALTFHPDKAIDDNSATEKFQVMQKIYDVLKDEETKKIYDETGEWPTEDDMQGVDFDTAAFARLDSASIESFKKEYQGSELEREDIINFYNEGEGSLIHIFDNLFFSSVLDDKERIQEIIDGAIEAGEIEKFPEPKGQAQKWKKYVSKAEKEAKEAEEMLKAIKEKAPKRVGDNNGSSLESMILARAQSRETDFLDALAAKYCGGGEKKKRRTK